MSLEHTGGIEPGSYVPTRLSYVSKACFYVTLVEDETLLQAIRETLKETNEGKKKTINSKCFTTGDAVSVLDEADQLWHRGLVTGCFGHLTEVLLVDSGKDIVTERNMLQELPNIPLVIAFPAKAIRCTLSDKNVSLAHFVSMQNDIGCQFLTHFEREEDGLWEVKQYLERVYPANSPDKAVLNNSRSLSSQSEEIRDNLIVETGFKHFPSETAVGTARQRLCIAMKDKIFTSNSDTNLESHCTRDNNGMHLNISGPCTGLDFDAYASDCTCQTSRVKPWKGTFYSKSDKCHSSKNDAKKSLRHPKDFGSYENLGFHAELQHAEKGTDATSIGDVLSHELYEMFNRSCVIIEKPENITPKTSVAYSQVENKEAQRLCITELVTNKDYDCAANSSDESIKDLQQMQNSNTQKCPSIPKAQIRCNVELKAIISNIDDDERLWILAADHIPSLDKLMSQINETNADYLKTFKDKPSINSPCLSLYSEDQRFYRAIVKEYIEDDKDSVLVHYVDYGNSDNTEVSTLRAIPDRFLDLPCQAIQCNFPKSIRPQLLEVFLEEIENIFTEEVNVTLVEDPLENTLILKSCIISGSDIVSKIRKEVEDNCTTYKGIESEEISHENKVNEVSSTCMKIPHLSIEYETEMAVYVTHVDNIGKFWVQISSNYPQIENMMVVMNDLALNSENMLMSSPNIGEPCFCPYSKDGQLYRAEIRKINTQVSSAVVHYIDYGDTGNVEMSNLYILPKQFLALPRQAICCYFSSEIRSQWSSSTQKYLDELLEKEIYLTLTPELEGSEYTNVVKKLTLDSSDVVSQLTSLVPSNDSNREISKSEDDSDTEEMLQIENAESEETFNEKILKSENDKSEDVLCEEDISQILFKHDENVDAFVSHVEGSCIWIQLLDHCTILEELQENLNSCSLQPLTGVPVVGSICIGYFTDDEMFYRALVKEVDLTCHSALVQYIDFGNSSLVKFKDLYILPFDFISLPRQGVECYFSNFSKVSKESIDELLNKEVTVSFSSNSGEGKNILRSCIVDDEDILLSEGLHASDVEERSELPYEVKPQKEITREAPVFVDTLFHLPPPQILYDKLFSAFVCLIERDSIWIQSSQYLPALKELTEKLNTIPLVKMQNFPSVEFPCVSRLDEDGKYYRVIVKKVDTIKLTAVVEFVDYGKISTVTFEDLFDLPECCYSLPKQAIQCYFRHKNKASELYENKVELLEQFVEISLDLVDDTGGSINVISNCTWSSTDIVSSSRARNSESIKSLSEITNESVIEEDNEIVKPDSYNRVEESDNQVDFELKENTGTNISVSSSRISSSDCSKVHCKDNSTDENIVMSPQPSLKCEELFTAIVSHIEDDASLWIQPCRNIPSLNALMEKLNESSGRSLMPLEDTPLVGNVYACSYVEDARWYRATVKEILTDKCLALVHYIDYGNEECVKINELRTIPEDLLSLPSQAVHCFFDKTINKGWSEEQQSLMEETDYEVRVSVCRDARDCGYLVFKDFFIGETDILSLLESNEKEPQVLEMRNSELDRTELRSTNSDSEDRSELRSTTSDSEPKLDFSGDMDKSKSLAATSEKQSLSPTEKGEGMMKVSIQDYKFRG